MALTAPSRANSVHPVSRRARLSLAAPVPPASVASTGPAGTVRTARRIARATIVESEGRYRQLFDHALDAIVFVDNNGRYVEANPAACEMLGWSHDQMLERGPADLMVDLASVADLDAAWTRFRARDVADLERSARDMEIRANHRNQIRVAHCDLSRPETFVPAMDAAAERLFRVTVKMFMDAHTFHEARIRQCCVHTGTFESDPRRHSFCWRWLFADAKDEVTL
jgi:PAS domain S-box-containing protein